MRILEGATEKCTSKQKLEWGKSNDNGDISAASHFREEGDRCSSVSSLVGVFCNSAQGKLLIWVCWIEVWQAGQFQRGSSEAMQRVIRDKQHLKGSNELTWVRNDLRAGPLSWAPTFLCLHSFWGGAYLGEIYSFVPFLHPDKYDLSVKASASHFPFLCS